VSTSLQAVVKRMSVRKSIRLMSTELNKLSENLYPRGDIEYMVDKLQIAGLEPFGQIRQRGQSTKDSFRISDSRTGLG
jgi:hypothetical protein